MALLEYRLKAVGEADLARSLASVEQRFAVHARRINQTLTAGGGSVRRTGGGSTRSMSADARAATMVERNAMRARLMDQKASIKMDVDAHRRRLRAIEVEKRAEIRKQSEVIRREARERTTARRQFTRATGGGISGAMGAIGSIGRAGAATLGVGGSILAGAAVHEAMSLEERIRRFVVAGRGTGSAGMDPGAVRGSVMRTAIARGIDPEAVMAGAQQFQTVTGRGDVGLRMADTFATFAQATGGDPTKIADTAAALFQNLKIEDIDALTEALAKLTFQGKKGSLEFDDLSGILGRVTAGLTGRGIGGGAAGVSKMGAALQVIQRGTGDASLTATATDAMFRQMVAKAKDLQSGAAFGGKKVEIFEGGDPTKAMRGDIDKLIADTLLASGGDAISLQKVFGDEGMRGLNMFSAEFKRAGGGDKGHAAVMALFKEFTEVGGDYAEIQRDAADVQKATSVQLSIATMELKQAFADELLPIVRELVPQLKEMAPAARRVTVAAVSLGKTLADNPLLGLGAIIGAAITLEVGKAQLASALQTGLIGPLGIAGLAVAGAAMAFMAAKAMVDNMVAQAESKARGAVASGDEVRSRAEAEIEATGKISPETRAQLEQLRDTESGVLSKADRVEREGTLDTLGRFGRSVGATLGLNNETGTLGEGMTLMKTAGNMDYVEGMSRTKGLLAFDDSAARFATSANAAGEQLTAAASKAGEIIKKKAGEAALNRGDSPSKPTK